MGCYYWECKYNDQLQKGEIGDCGKPNESNIVQPCPKQGGDICTDGEKRETD